ncbi:zinc finger and BTB domain-containing protein 22, partial [Coregonus clupeaformis]|uniref:zinc finger and BTB domain-containing protein 22 n=1 Tax=Coregonus clupeaformis TaxID=59861 RepID=UPI001E1C3C49
MYLPGHHTSVFTFQSAVHSSHVLKRLNDQRLGDVLCDVTLVAGSRMFRAHCSVLASCSDYFYSRIINHTSPSLVLTLPDQVTAEGFEPLLQFSYTAKLLFTKDNILAIHRCARLLGFHNLETSCFDFLLPKFLEGSSRTTAQEGGRGGCCQGRSQISSSNQGKSPSGRSPNQVRSQIRSSNQAQGRTQIRSPNQGKSPSGRSPNQGRSQMRSPNQRRSPSVGSAYSRNRKRDGDGQSPSVDSAHCTGCQSQSRTPNQGMSLSQARLPSGRTPSQGRLPSVSLAHNTDRHTDRDREQQVGPRQQNTGPGQTTGSDVRNIGSDIRPQCSAANPSGTISPPSHQSLTVPSDGNVQIDFQSSSQCPNTLALLVNPVSGGREQFCMSPLSLGGLTSSSGLGVRPILALPCPGGVDGKPDPDAVFSDGDILGMEAAACPMAMGQGEGCPRGCPLSCELPSPDDVSPSDLMEAADGEMDGDQSVVGSLMAEEAGCSPGSCGTCPLRGSVEVEEAEQQQPALDLLARRKSPSSEKSGEESHGGCPMLPRSPGLGQVGQLPVLERREDPGLDGGVAVGGHLSDSALTDPTLCGLTPDDAGYGLGERSSVEREVAEHLAKGFWPDLCPSQTEPLPSLPNLDIMEHGGLGRVPNLDTMEHGGLGRVPNLDIMEHSGLGTAADFHWQLDLNSNPGDCPFLRDLGTGEAGGIEEVGGVGEVGE